MVSQESSSAAGTQGMEKSDVDESQKGGYRMRRLWHGQRDYIGNGMYICSEAYRAGGYYNFMYCSKDDQEFKTGLIALVLHKLFYHRKS